MTFKASKSVTMWKSKLFATIEECSASFERSLCDWCLENEYSDVIYEKNETSSGEGKQGTIDPNSETLHNMGHNLISLCTRWAYEVRTRYY